MFPSNAAQLLHFPSESHNKCRSEPNTCRVDEQNSVWRLLKRLFLFYFLFFSPLRCSGRPARSVSCRLGNGAKAEPPLFNLAAALAVRSRGSSADTVTLPQKHSPCLCLSFSITQIFWFHSLSSYLFLSASPLHQNFPLFLFRYLSPSVFSFLSSPDLEISHQSPFRSLTPSSQKQIDFSLHLFGHVALSPPFFLNFKLFSFCFGLLFVSSPSLVPS